MATRRWPEVFKKYRKLWWALGAFMILTPLGLIATGTAFGEWSVEEVLDEVGFIPAGLEKMADIWTLAPLPDYSIPGLTGSFLQSAAGYIFSAIVGVVLVVAIISLFNKLVQD
jgi:PDGLE domain